MCGCRCQCSSGSVAVAYELVLKTKYSAADLITLMQIHIENNNGRMGAFEISSASVKFSGNLSYGINHANI